MTTETRLIRLSPGSERPLAPQTSDTGRHVWLVGMMASGKSTIAGILGNRLDATKVDTDGTIVAQRGKSIAEIFAQIGEPGFRQLEHELVLRLGKSPEDMVISTGGGAPCYHNNISHMTQTGITVFLDGSPALLARRTIEDDEKAGKFLRPLLKELDEGQRMTKLGTILDQRRAFYEKARITISIDGKDIRGIVEEILEHNKMKGLLPAKKEI